MPPCSSAGLRRSTSGAGGWHAEWDALSGALAVTGGAAAAVADLLEGLEVDEERMRANIDEAVLSERASSSSGSSATP